jgi:hypothetical protein
MRRPFMDNLKGLTEVVQQLVYETIGLLLPGALAVVAVSAAIAPGEVRGLFDWAGRLPVPAVGLAYVLGYVVQGLSRPVTQGAEDVLAAIPRLLLRFLPRAAVDALERLERHLTGRHAHRPGSAAGEAVSLPEIAGSYWANKLGVPVAALREGDVRDLSFSEVGDRTHLDRFRAATSLCRGAAFSVVLVLAILIAKLVLGVPPATPRSYLIIAVLVVVFYALLERADMYDRLWRSVVPAQFLAAASHSAPLSRLAVPAPPVGSRDVAGNAGEPTEEAPAPVPVPQEKPHAQADLPPSR